MRGKYDINYSIFNVINSYYLCNKDKTHFLGLIFEQEVKWQPVCTYRRI